MGLIIINQESTNYLIEKYQTQIRVRKKISGNIKTAYDHFETNQLLTLLP